MSEGARVFFITNFWLAILAAIAGIVLSCTLFCVPSVARKVPLNYYLMIAFTVCEAYMVAFCCAAVNDGLLVLTAACMTSGMVIALTIYAMTTKTDFTVLGGLFYVVGSCFLLFGLFSFLMGPTMRLVYCCFGVILFGVYLVIDTQLILGGRR